MKAAEFTRRRARIEANTARTPAWRKKAVAALMREARARPFTDNGKLAGYRVGDGQHVCLRTRYETWHQAQDALEQIARMPGAHKKPNWFHPCSHCHGWHLAWRANPTKAA